MAEDSGFCDMEILLQSFKQSEGDEAQDVLKTIAEHLKNDIKMKEHFHEVNGVSVILNVAMSANFSVLNLIFDTLAAAAEDHDGNKIQLTHERTFIIINKVLLSVDSLGIMACFRPLVLLSYVCAENAHAQELANISGCVKEMEKLFLRLSQDILESADGKDEKVVFTWNILCTAIASACGEPANQKNQDILRSVVREGANFLNECIDKSRITLKDASCVKNLLIMLPYVLHGNQANQDFFARSGGVHAIVNGLGNLEKQKNLDCDFTEIYIKLVYLLSVSLIENAQISKLAGFLGVIPILVQLMKQLSKKDKGIVLLCLANLLSCPENEKIFQHLDVSTYLISEMENFGESSECWKLLDKICNYLTEKQKSSNNLDLFGSSSSSVIDEKNKHPFTRYMQNGQKKMEKHPKNQEFDLNSEKNLNTKSITHQKKLSDGYYVDKDKSRNHNEYPQSPPSYYKRSHNIRNDDNFVDEKFMKRQYERKKHPYEHGEVCYRRYDDSEPVMLNKFHKYYDKTRHSLSPSDCSKKDMYTSYDDGYFLKLENAQSRQFLQTKDSSSDLINRARRLYPRNKMSELEEIDVHQKRHYFTKRENFARHDETGREQLRTLGSTSPKNYFDADNDPRENYGRRAMKGNPGGDFRREDLRKDWQRPSIEKYVREYYDTDTEERKESVMDSMERRSRIDKPRKDYQSPPGRFLRNYLDDQNRELGKKLIGFARDDYNTNEGSRKQFQRKSLERWRGEDDNDSQLQRERFRLPRGRGQTTDREIEIRREQGKGLIDSFMKVDKTFIKEPWKDDPKRSRGSKSLEALKRSKSVARVNELDIQSMLKDMDLVRCSPNEKSSLLCSEVTRISNSSEGNRAESPVMPMLLNVRDMQHKITSPPQSPQKSILKTPSDHESSTQSMVNFKNEEEKSDTKYENHYSANDKPVNQKNNDDKLAETGGNEQATNLPAKTPFSEEEDRYLVQGIEKFGLDFKTIYQEFKFHEKRTPHDLYEKWRFSYNF